MSSDFEQQQKSPATQQAEECSSMKIKPDSELPVLTTHSSTSVEKPLSIYINAAESVEGPSSNEKLNITPNASSLHSNQSTTHESQTSRNSDSVCGCCGLETAQIRPMDMDISSSMSLSSQEAAKMRRQETAAQYLMQPSEEEPHEWIYCNACQKWFHSLCVGLEQYEVHLIDKFHCPTCLLLPHNGPSTMKVKRLLHRYAFDKEEECDQPEQIGTEAWTNDFLNKYCEYPEAVEHSMAKTYENGTELMKNFNMHQDWTEPIKVLNKTGLGLKMPNDPSFDIKNVVDLLGRHINVQTIDVFAQQTYSMSLGRFHDIWNQPKRDRLYNILSLEFTDTKLDEIVRSPTLAKELSWVENFWPNSGNEGERPNEPTDVYEFSDKPMAAAEQQESARPYVEHYCLMGMQGSYTDFHIDFGGSSVWYHVFKGEKVFFIVRPTSENLAAFLRWQKDEKRSEQFFGHFLPPGEKLYRLHVFEGETLFLPAGWIHSVFTPKDSLVFGGNFLHSLNVPMQMKVFDMELEAGIEERFKFPYFELCNFYATKYLGEQLKDYKVEGKLAKQVLLDAASELYKKCSEWLGREKNKFSIFNGNVNSLNRELKSQLNLQKILSYESKQKRIDNPLSSSSPINMDNNSNGVHLRKLDRPRMVKGQIQDMDSSWEEGEDYEMMEQEYNVEEEDGECSSDTEGVNDELQSQAPLLNRKRKNHPPDQLRKFVVKQQNINSATGTADDNNEQQSSSATAFVENGTEGHVRLKIRLPPTQLPCWRQRQATTTQQSERIGSSPIGKRMNGKKTSASVKMDEEEEPNLAAMFTTPSTHGRQRRTTARVLGGIPNSQENRQNSAGDALTHPRDHSDMDVLTPVAQRANKNFMDQYTPEERYQIELSDKAGEMDARGELFSQSAMKKPPSKRATKKKEKKPKDVTSGSGQATESTTPKNPAEKKQPIKKRGTEPKKMSSRERVAKKIGFRLK